MTSVDGKTAEPVACARAHPHWPFAHLQRSLIEMGPWAMAIWTSSSPSVSTSSPVLMLTGWLGYSCALMCEEPAECVCWTGKASGDSGPLFTPLQWMWLIMVSNGWNGQLWIPCVPKVPNWIAAQCYVLYWGWIRNLEESLDRWTGLSWDLRYVETFEILMLQELYRERSWCYSVPNIVIN